MAIFSRVSSQFVHAYSAYYIAAIFQYEMSVHDTSNSIITLVYRCDVTSSCRWYIAMLYRCNNIVVCGISAICLQLYCGDERTKHVPMRIAKSLRSGTYLMHKSVHNKRSVEKGQTPLNRVRSRWKFHARTWFGFTEHRKKVPSRSLWLGSLNNNRKGFDLSSECLRRRWSQCW